MDRGVVVDYKKTAIMFKAFCDENRLQILSLLQSGEKCACKLLEEMQITQPTLSHHMKILCDAGVVTSRKEGKWMHYCISEDGMQKVREYVDRFVGKTNEKDEKSCCKGS